MSESEKGIEMASRSMSVASAILTATWVSVIWSLREIWHATSTWTATSSVSCSLHFPFFRDHCGHLCYATARLERQAV